MLLWFDADRIMWFLDSEGWSMVVRDDAPVRYTVHGQVQWMPFTCNKNLHSVIFCLIIMMKCIKRNQNQLAGWQPQLWRRYRRRTDSTLLECSTTTSSKNFSRTVRKSYGELLRVWLPNFGIRNFVPQLCSTNFAEILQSCSMSSYREVLIKKFLLANSDFQQSRSLLQFSRFLGENASSLKWSRLKSFRSWMIGSPNSGCHLKRSVRQLVADFEKIIEILNLKMFEKNFKLKRRIIWFVSDIFLASSTSLKTSSSLPKLEERS